MLFALTTTACDDYLLGEAPDAPCYRDPPFTYENFGEGWLSQHCNGCHTSFKETDLGRSGAPVGVDFNTWADILVWADRIYDRTVVATSMPPAGGPSEAERGQFDEWMRCEVLPAAGRQ